MSDVVLAVLAVLAGVLVVVLSVLFLLVVAPAVCRFVMLVWLIAAT